MSNDVVIRVENLWKQYRYGTISHATLRKDFQSWWARFRGKEDPNLPIGMEQRSNAMPSALSAMRGSEGDDRFWALRDVSFEVKRGEVLGIIGKNGAGKSTLLKIMSKVTTPTKGQIKIRGRVASLLEVGTGFHPELTGRENIFLNGAILGMTKNDIKRQFEEIVSFAEIEKFVDTPVKRYSSGMYVRLAFAVAAHLEPEILIVDEVLAVGDAEFQKKCLGKMQDVAEHDRTVLFVSHNMASMKQLCQRGILLKDGVIDKDEKIENVVNHYLSRGSISHNTIHFSEEQHRIKSSFQIASLTFVLPEERSLFLFGERIALDLSVRCLEPLHGVRIGVGLVREGVRICTFQSRPLDFDGNSSSQTVRCTLPDNILLPGNFSLVLGGHLARNGRGLDYIAYEIPFEVSEVSADDSAPYDVKAVGLIQLEADWQLNTVNTGI